MKRKAKLTREEVVTKLARKVLSGCNAYGYDQTTTNRYSHGYWRVLGRLARAVLRELDAAKPARKGTRDARH